MSCGSGPGWACSLISHDLAVVAERCSSISAMRDGEVVEAGDTIATLLIGLEKDRQPHLQAAIVRIVDVKSVVIL